MAEFAERVANLQQSIPQYGSIENDCMVQLWLETQGSMGFFLKNKIWHKFCALLQSGNLTGTFYSYYIPFSFEKAKMISDLGITVWTETPIMSRPYSYIFKLVCENAPGIAIQNGAIIGDCRFEVISYKDDTIELRV